MKFETLICILSITIVSSTHAQNLIKTEDEKNLYWQQEVRIDYSHFISKSDTDCVKYNEKYGLKMSPSIQLYGVVDIPESHLSKKIKKRIGDDKLYIAPVFCKTCSCLLAKDSVELVVSQLIFDVAELAARGLRKELLEMQKDMNINNVNTMYFVTIRNKWEDKMYAIWGSIYQDVLIQKKDSSYEEWRKFTDELLEELKQFATQPIEISRLIQGRPLEKDYLKAEFIVGDLRRNDQNE